MEGGAQPPDLVESLGYLDSTHVKDRTKPLLNISRQWVSKSMKVEPIDWKDRQVRREARFQAFQP